jgi:AcrR family transcriptional regulator
VAHGSRAGGVYDAVVAMTGKSRRSNAERVAETRGALLDAAAELFGRLGYEGTSTTAILEASGLTRGAMYHHFADKRDLFVAVASRVERALIADIEAATASVTDARQRVRAGVMLYLDAVSRPDRARILLRDAPAVLGPARWRELADAAWTRQFGGLISGLPGNSGKASQAGAVLPVLLGAAIDRAALALADGVSEPAAIKASVGLLLERMLG